MSITTSLILLYFLLCVLDGVLKALIIIRLQRWSTRYRADYTTVAFLANVTINEVASVFARVAKA